MAEGKADCAGGESVDIEEDLDQPAQETHDTDT